MPVAFPGPVAPGWIAAGVVLHLLNQLARGRGWLVLVRLAVPLEAPGRDVLAAWVAGAGASGILSARGGDCVRLLMVGRRLPERRYGALTGSLVAETAGESLLGVTVAAVAVALGLWTLPVPAPPDGLALLAGGAVVAGCLAQRRPRSVVARFACDVWRGLKTAGSPLTYARRVLPWQLASRVLRAVAVACFLIGFGVSPSVATVLLFVLAQSGGRVIPFGPAGAAAAGALVAAGAGAATGGAVSPETLAGCFVAMTATLTVVGVVVAVACVAWTSDLRTLAQMLASRRRRRMTLAAMAAATAIRTPPRDWA